ncbi:GDP-mannose 4,6-dehydratase [bacterium]|nr:GDP-mannose 4,6-dehydratase [bacterium]
MSTLITGIEGQDGGYLAELLLEQGERVIGTVRPGLALPAETLALESNRNCELTSIDMLNLAGLRTMLRNTQPDRIVHLAAASRPAMCEADPIESRTINVSSAEVILDWVHREKPQCRVLLLSSSAIFGDPLTEPQDEATERRPINEYGRQKLEVSKLAKSAREQGMFVSCAIPFNHESPRRSEDFVFAKIVNSAARISLGQQDRLELGALNARRDWGYAPEFVKAFAWMLEVEKPLELVLATGELHSVQELVDSVFDELKLDRARHLRHSEDLLRQGDPREQVGNPARAWTELGWEPTVKFRELWRLMLADALQRCKAIPDEPAVEPTST